MVACLRSSARHFVCPRTDPGVPPTVRTFGVTEAGVHLVACPANFMSLMPCDNQDAGMAAQLRCCPVPLAALPAARIRKLKYVDHARSLIHSHHPLHAGNSVCAFVHGFLPYLYIEAPTQGFNPEDCDSLRCALNVSSSCGFTVWHMHTVREWRILQLLQWLLEQGKKRVTHSCIGACAERIAL